MLVVQDILLLRGESYLTYILNRLWWPVIVPFGGEIRTYTPHPKILTW